VESEVPVYLKVLVSITARAHRFERGVPARDATRQARDDAGYERALTAYRFWCPTVSIEGSRAAEHEGP
jgi:hypothetical protein